jgi:two-component system sensor histidine kinase/response regulator
MIDSSTVIVSVKDFGKGISTIQQEQLFSLKHYNTEKAREKGSGLGLLLCKDFVEKHEGKIWVVSEEGKGSEFKFSLPYIKH